MKALFLITLSLTSIVFSLPTLSQQEIFDYTPPKSIEATQPNYPRTALEQGLEGHVIFNMMIAPDGKMYDPIVVESTSALFESPSLEALEKMKFEPATLNGVASDGSHYYKFSYALAYNPDEPIAANDPFLRAHRFFTDTFQKGDIDKAHSYQKKMEELANSKYKIAWTALAGFYIAKAQNQPQAQLSYLKEALAYHPDDSLKRYSSGQMEIFSDERELTAYAELFMTQLQLNRYAEAISTFQILEHRNYEYLDRLVPVLEKVKSITTSSSPYRVSGHINIGNQWAIKLFKKGFYIDTQDGRLEEIKLHCSTKFVLFAYNEENQYTIPDNWGECTLFLVGDPGTSFRVVQI